MTPKSTTADRARPRPELASPQADGTFVLNLSSSTTPMALVQPKDPQLARFTFFVSRRREEGRERFRLHMGYFGTQAEAETWLPVVRDIYPGAWAGEAPGQKLKATQDAADSGVRPAPAPTPAAAAPAAVTSPPVAKSPPVVTAPPAATPATARAAAPKPVPAKPPAAPSQPPVDLRKVPTLAPAAPAAPARPAAKAGVPNSSNIREVLAELDGGDTGRTPAPRVPAAPIVPAAPKAAAPARPTAPNSVAARAEPVDTAATRQMPAPPALPTFVQMNESASLTDSQVLTMLERRRDDHAAPPVPVPASGSVDGEIEMLRPDDARTMSELRQDLAQNAQVSFAVQLDWSVQPIDLTRVPPLAIFSAYTLYTVEGNREGRKWYGLRLGFFSDSVSAKQVAYYVRSEFNSVAVVPVSVSERRRASDDGKLPASAIGPRKGAEKVVDEFKLLDDTGSRPGLAATAAPAAPTETAKPARPAKAAGAPPPAARPASRRAPPSRPAARAKSPEATLEETLEILGANTLSIDTGVETINDSGVRHLNVKVDKRTSKFARLLDRLSDKISGS